MSIQLKVYLCVVTEDNRSDIITSNNYCDLIQKVINSILDTKLEDYPNINSFDIPNSIDFIGDYDEDEYRDILNEMLCSLAANGCSYNTQLMTIDQEIEEENLVNISHDLL